MFLWLGEKETKVCAYVEGVRIVYTFFKQKSGKIKEVIDVHSKWAKQYFVITLHASQHYYKIFVKKISNVHTRT